VERGFFFQVVHRSNGAICLPMFDFPHLDTTVQALNALKLFPRGYQQINGWDRHLPSKKLVFELGGGA